MILQVTTDSIERTALGWQDHINGFVGNFVQGDLQRLLTAIIIFFIGWLIAKGIQSLVTNLLKKTNWDEKLIGDESGKQANSFFGKLVYYIIMLFVLMLVLNSIGLSGALGPLDVMLQQFVAAIPKVIFAGIIAYLGYMLAKIVSNLVSLSGGVIDNWVDKTGFKDTNQFVTILQKVVFILIFIPFVIQALTTLDMEAISVPATNLLHNFTEMIGQVLIAAAVLFLFVWGGKFLTDFLKDLFQSLKLDTLSTKMGLQNMIGEGQSVSKLLASVIYFFIIFFGVITAVDILELHQLTAILNEILEITGQILFGLVILVIGNYISKLIYDAMTRTNNNQFVANIVRWASLALFIAIALRQMGIANEIVELAFGAIVLSLAVVVALAYGLGGREAAGEHFREIISKFRNGDQTPKV